MHHVLLQGVARLLGVLALGVLGVKNNLRLVFDVLVLVGQVVEGEIDQSLLGGAEFAGQIGMLHAENLALIGQFGTGHHFQQPGGGGHGAAGGVGQSGSAADAEQRIARDRIQRLNPAVEQDGQAAPGGHVKAVGRLGRRHTGQEPGGKNSGQNPGQPFFHGPLLLPASAGRRVWAGAPRRGDGWRFCARFLAKPTRCIRNCTTNPAATRLHAT